MSLYNSNGSINITVVDGSTFVGAFAADGSMNVTVSDPDVFCGLIAPDGSRYVTVVTAGAVRGFYAPNGSLYVSESQSEALETGTQYVTVISGTLGGLTPAMAMLTAYSCSLTDEVAGYEATYTGASHKFVYDSDGLLKRAIHNLFLNSTDLDATAWTTVSTNASYTSNISDPFGGTNATTITASAANGRCVQGVSLGTAPTNAKFGIWVRRRTGSGNVYLEAPSVGVGTLLSLTSDWQFISETGYGGGTTYYTGFRIDTSGDAIDVYGAHVYLLTNGGMQRNWNNGTTYLPTGASVGYGPRFSFAPETLEASTTSITIGSGSSYTFTTAAAHSFAGGDVVQATDNADPDNYVRGYVTATTSTTVTLASYTFPGTAYTLPVLTNGSGTISDWSVIRSDGYLAEPAATNICTRSNDLSYTSPWSTDPTGLTVAANQVGPDGIANSAWTLTDTDTGLRSRTVLATVANDSTTYTVSCYFKKTTSAASFPGFGFYITGGTPVYSQITFDTDNGAVIDRTGFGPTSSSVEDLGDYWRVSVTKANNSTGNTSLYGVISPAVATSAVGSWTSTVTGSTVVYGFQMETGSVATSYIPTAASSVARSADVASMTGANFSGWWNASEGTIFSKNDYYHITNISQGYVWYISDGTGNEVFSYSNYASGGTTWRASVAITDGGASQYAVNPATAPPSQFALAYKLNDTNEARDGTAGTLDTSVTIPTVTRMDIGYLSLANAPGYGTISQIMYFNTRVADADLVTLTGG